MVVRTRDVDPAHENTAIPSQQADSIIIDHSGSIAACDYVYRESSKKGLEWIKH